MNICGASELVRGPGWRLWEADTMAPTPVLSITGTRGHGPRAARHPEARIASTGQKILIPQNPLTGHSALWDLPLPLLGLGCHPGSQALLRGPEKHLVRLGR